MALNIEKRVRALATDNWGAWTITTDAPPYTDTDLLEYRTVNEYNTHEPVTIDVTDLTQGASVETDDGYVWEGTGVFDTIMESVNGNVQAQYDSGRLVGQNYATVYLGSLQVALQTAVQFLLTKDTAEAKADSARFAAGTAEFNLDNTVPLQLEKLQEEYDLMEDTHNSKVDLAARQVDKLVADTGYVNEQESALVRTLIDNRKIKALDSLSDTYGTFGAGGLDVDPEMWTVYFNLVSRLAADLNTYQGKWDALNNVPDLAAIPSPTPGDYYIVDGAGNGYLDGEIAVYLNGQWTKSDAMMPDTAGVHVAGS